MKQLFRHTTSLLRTALLLGAVILVNTQIVKAQTDAQWAEMPDAFETIDPTTVDWSQEPYFFIQFSEGNVHSFLGEYGNGALMRGKDYVPFSKSIQWTLVPTGVAGKYYLKSQNGLYAYYPYAEKYCGTSSTIDSNTLIFTLYKRSDGFFDLTIDGLVVDGKSQCIGRENGLEWGGIRVFAQNSPRARVRFAKLKSNAAHIIYYKDGGAYANNVNGPDNTETRHYLTYSGADSELSSSAIINGDFQGTDVSCFFFGDPNHTGAYAATITNGVGKDGSRGISITSSGSSYEWDTQFFIRSREVIPVGKTIHVEFDYKADRAVSDVASQAHAEPGAYRTHGVLANLNFTTDWQHYTGDIIVTADMNDFQTIAFNLWKNNSAATYYFDNIVFNAPSTPQVSSRRTIIPPDKSLWTLPTAAAYHQDGLWELVPTGNDGEFYIKRYNEEQYLTVRQIDTYRYCSVLGSKDDVYGKFILETPVANRYTRIKNNCPLWGLQRYFSYNDGDGSAVIQGAYNNTTWWYAGFYPVEVPVPNKDNFFQVLVKWGDNMINHNGGVTAPCPTNEAEYDLWQLEQIDDYWHFRLKAPNGGYLKPSGNGVTAPNDPTDAEVLTNEKFWTDFALTWYYVNPAQKEFPVNYMVTHRESYLKQYAEQYADMELDKQGLATGAQSDWWNYEKQIQKVNHFEITHYVKEGNSMVVEFPTVLNKSNDHVYYQRFYNYDEDENSMDLDNLKAHVSLDTRDDGNVQYYLYRNGIVTGQKLNWDGKDNGGMARIALRRFNFTNSDGQPFTVAVDVSRYSDLTYKGATPETGDLEEPSLTMRYIYYMKDAKEMAKNLTACKEGSGKWLETKTFHFPMKQIFYENQKKVGYRGEFIGLRHVFSDYWVFNDGDPNSTDNNNLVSAVIDNTQGRIEVEIVDDNGTGIRKGGYNPNIDLKGTTEGVDADYQGFYFYDKMSDQNKTQYGDSRFVVFRYPSTGEVAQTGADHPAYVNVYLNNNGTRYQLAQFTVIFDPGTVTLPYTSVNGSTYVKDEDANTSTYTDGSETKYFKDRDPKKLVEKAGKPIAKITFDYPTGDSYHFPAQGDTKHGWGTPTPGSAVNGSSPIPMTFDKTNYSYDAFECNWGSYSITTNMSTNYGNHKNVLPANDNDKGYGDASVQALQADPGLQKAFLYIDASEQPGDICSAPFIGDFCSGDKLLFSGWISSSNKMGGDDNRCPGGITLTVKGEHNVHNADGTIKYDEKGNPVKETVTLYRFCPGQIYELDNGGGVDGSSGDGSTHVVWQQFYFEFTVTDKYDRHWIEVNNNCVSSQGGDFMLDNIAVYAIVPEVKPGVNTPVCVDKNGNTEMRLLKLSVDFNKQISSAGVNSGKAELGFVFLEKDLFLKTFRTELQKLTDAEKTELHLEAFNFNTISLDVLADAIKDGEFKAITGEANGKGNIAYRTAFDAAIVGDKKTYYTKNAFTAADKNASIIYFQYNSDFSQMPAYSFASAVNKEYAVYGEEINGERYIVMNGNYPEMNWKANTDYYILISNRLITSGEPFSVFNLCSECNKASEFRIEPPYSILGLESSEDANSYVVCEGQIPTLLTDLKGYDLNGNEVPMKDLNFDWWLGNSTTPATLDNYHAQTKGGIKLDRALSTLRIYYPDATDLDGIIGHLAVSPNPELTLDMVNYLKELVAAGELVLHQKSISVPAKPALEGDPYFYLVACPIHDEKFDQALNPQANQYVAFFCDEPQGLRIKVGEKAPTLKTGFVPSENGFDTYDYTGAADAILSIRLAKKEQFEQVQHGTTADVPADGYETSAPSTDHFLWLPIRNAETQTATGVIRKSQDYNIYLASTNDPTWDKNIYTSMKAGALPIVGKIVKLTAVNTVGNTNLDQQNEKNRLCVYFTENFEVREGYSYMLSLPFQEEGDVNTCDGTILINLKIVPDYEVWTGAAGNTDWNNDENWRRADGNTEDSNGVNGDELYVSAAVTTSPLNGYKTNQWNYRTAKDRLFRKGFAPLYCTHILMKSDEWGNAPQLYDGLDGKDALAKSPFPNLRDYDNWNGYNATATATPILRYDMQAREHSLWPETYGEASNKGRDGDLIAEMYQINSCDEIAFQPGAELLNAHLLNYNNAWVEYQLDNKRWYLLGSPLQGTVSGEWYAPTGNAKQETTYYDPVTFGSGYDRYSPAIYQRSWDKAKAVLYEVGSTYSTADDSQTENLGSTEKGQWMSTQNQTTEWQAVVSNTNETGADSYLDRLGYKPFGDRKANVAIKGVWSNTYNDATVDYASGGFSVMVMNHLKNNDSSNGKAVIRLPKEDTMYDYYEFSQDGDDNGGTDTELGTVQNVKHRAKNRGRLKSDLLLPATTQKTEATASRYGDARTYTRIPIKQDGLITLNNSFNEQGGNPAIAGSFTETIPAGISTELNYYLVENPFPCGLNMNYFFRANPGLEKKYWLLTAKGQHLVQKATTGEWVSPTLHTGEGDFYDTGFSVLAPGQGFFVEATTHSDNLTVTFNRDMQVQSRFGVQSGTPRTFTIEVGQKQVMEELKEGGETVYTTVDLNGNGIYGETNITIEGQTVDEKEPVMVPVYEEDGETPKTEPITADVKIYSYEQTTSEDYKYPLKARTRGGDAGEASPLGLVITAERAEQQSSALVMQREGASNDFLPEEDTETFINSDLENVPTVYTLCGRLATTINSIHDFRSLPVGVESNSSSPCTLTFRGVETLGDSIAFYDALEQKLMPLESGMKVTVSGQTQNRYYIVRSLNQKDAAEETHLQIFTEGLTAKVIASTAEPITDVRCFDTAGRLIHSANPQISTYSFSLPAKGIYIIEAQTGNDRKTVKLMAK